MKALLQCRFDEPVPPGRTLGALALILLVAAAPLGFGTNPPLMDYPFHLARLYILDHWKDSPALQQSYEIGSFVLPNMGLDLVGLGLAKIFSVVVVGRIFLGLTLAMILSGCVVLHRCAHGYFSFWPLVSSLFLFNWIFLAGFTNYLLGIGLMLWAAGIWISLSPAAVWKRFVSGTVLCVCLFFCHLVALGLFAVIVAGYEIQRSAAIVRSSFGMVVRNALTGAAIFIVPSLLFMISPTSNAREAWTFTHPWWNRFAGYRTFESGNLAADAALLAGVIVAAIVIGLYGRLQVHRSMYLPLVLLVLTHLVAPYSLFSAAFLDGRLPIAILFIAIGCTQMFVRSKFYHRVLVLGFLMLLVFKSAILAYDWRQYEQVIKPIVAAFAKFPSGSILFAAREDPPDYFNHFVRFEPLDRRLWQPPLNHVDSLAALQQSTFVPTTYAERGQQPITVTPKYAKLYKFQDRDPIRVSSPQELAALIEQIRHVVVDSGLSPAPLFLLVLYPEYLHFPFPDTTTLVATGPHFAILGL